jgi:hypothetical protein
MAEIMANNRSIRASKWSAVLLLVLSLLPVYVLSSGPAAWWLGDSEFGLATWNLLYRPAGLLAETTGTEKPYVRYVQWWISRD